MRKLAVYGIFGIILIANSLAISGCAQLNHLWDSLRPPQEKVLAEDAKEPSATELNTPETSKLRIVQKSKAADVLEYLGAFQSLADDRQREEYRKVLSLYNERRSDLDRFRLAMLMLTPGKRFSNSLKGRDLLQAYLKEENSPDEDLAALARLLVRMVALQQDLEIQLVRAKENSEALAQQLNELKNIENIMKKREVDGLPGI